MYEYLRVDQVVITFDWIHLALVSILADATAIWALFTQNSAKFVIRLDDDEWEDDEDELLVEGQDWTANGAERREDFSKIGSY